MGYGVEHHAAGVRVSLNGYPEHRMFGTAESAAILCLKKEVPQYRLLAGYERVARCHRIGLVPNLLSDCPEPISALAGGLAGRIVLLVHESPPFRRAPQRADVEGERTTPTRWGGAAVAAPGNLSYSTCCDPYNHDAHVVDHGPQTIIVNSLPVDRGHIGGAGSVAHDRLHARAGPGHPLRSWRTCAGGRKN